MKLKHLITTFILTAAVSSQAADEIISLDKNGNRHVYSVSELAGAYGGTFDADALPEFKHYADNTGGLMGFCPQFEDLPKVLDLTLEEILDTENMTLDLAIVLDTTGSMGDEIEEVKKNLTRVIENLKAENQNRDLKVSLIAYKDLTTSGLKPATHKLETLSTVHKPILEPATDDYVTKIVQHLTSDLDLIDTSVQEVSVSGGGDTREAILDAFETAMNDLQWRQGADKNILMIGDAPGHKVSKTSGATVDEVLTQLASGDGIRVHPLLVANVGSGFGTGSGGGFGFPIPELHTTLGAE